MSPESQSTTMAIATPPAAGDQPFTVIGVWLGDVPVSIGVVAGVHEVLAGNIVIDGARAPFEDVWASTATAATAEEAEQLAMWEMAGTTVPDDEDGDDETPGATE